MTFLLPLLLLFLLIPFSLTSAFGTVDNFTTDKSLYHKDDQLNLSGTVSYDVDIPFVTIQIFTPGKLNFADFNTVPVNSDGSFSSIFHVGGPTWTVDGVYPIKVTYAGNLEKSIEYQEFTLSSQEPESEPQTESTSEPQTGSTSEPQTESTTEPQTESVSNFMTLKSQIPTFPSIDKSPIYYIERYNNEPSYKSWFDSQFHTSSIYNILGYDTPTSVPDWTINAAYWRSIDLISEGEFENLLKFFTHE
jgi:hypothetical protein